MNYRSSMIKRSLMHVDLLHLTQFPPADVIAQVAYCYKRTGREGEQYFTA